MIPTADIGTSHILLRLLALVLVYALLGFGPGVILGILVANRLAGYNKEVFMNEGTKKIQKAEKYNEQWNPGHKRWRKE